MCTAVYVATSLPVETTKWNKEAPAFYVKELEGYDELRRRFAPRSVYYAGSHEGCGCGFVFYDGDPERRRALDALIAFIRRVAPADVFVCWEGQQTEAPAWEKVVTSGDLGTGDLWAKAFETTDTAPCVIRVR